MRGIRRGAREGAGVSSGGRILAPIGCRVMPRDSFQFKTRVVPPKLLPPAAFTAARFNPPLQPPLDFGFQPIYGVPNQAH
jgi:hypothetical protein